MRAIILSALVTSGLVAACAPQAEPNAAPTRMEQRGMALLEGKVAEAAQRCIQTERINGTIIPDDRTILFRVNSTLLYRSDIGPPCPYLTDDRAIVTRTNVTQYCRGDQFRVVDPQLGTEYGACSFGDFVPYRRP